MPRPKSRHLALWYLLYNSGRNLPGKPTPIAISAVVVAASGIAFITLAVTLQEGIAENLLVLTPVTVGGIVAVASVFVVVGSLRIVTLAALCVSGASAQSVAVTLLLRNLVAVVAVA